MVDDVDIYLMMVDDGGLHHLQVQVVRNNMTHHMNLFEETCSVLMTQAQRCVSLIGGFMIATCSDCTLQSFFWLSFNPLLAEMPSLPLLKAGNLFISGVLSWSSAHENTDSTFSTAIHLNMVYINMNLHEYVYIFSSDYVMCLYLHAHDKFSFPHMFQVSCTHMLFM